MVRKKYVEDTINVLVDFFGEWAMLSALPARNSQELLANPVFTQVPSRSAGRLAMMTGGVAFQNWLVRCGGCGFRLLIVVTGTRWSSCISMQH